MDTVFDASVLAISCAVITFGTYARTHRKLLSPLIASMATPLVISGAASTVLNAFGKARKSTNGRINEIIMRIISPSFMCKLLFIRLFVFLSTLTQYEVQCDLLDKNACSEKTGCEYKDSNGNGISQCVRSAEAHSILTTKLYGMCGNYFQHSLGMPRVSSVPENGTDVKVQQAPYLLSVDFLASLAIHVPNHVTGPPILYSTLANQLYILQMHLRSKNSGLDYGTYLSVMATLGEVIMWTVSSLNSPEQQRFTHGIAMSFYIFGNANFSCFLLSIFARFFAPEMFFRKHGTFGEDEVFAEAEQGHACVSLLDGSALSAESIGANSHNAVDMANACKNVNFGYTDTEMSSHSYCLNKQHPFTPVVLYAKDQIL
jgi:hypothetical protein